MDDLFKHLEDAETMTHIKYKTFSGMSLIVSGINSTESWIQFSGVLVKHAGNDWRISCGRSKTGWRRKQ